MLNSNFDGNSIEPENQNVDDDFNEDKRKNSLLMMENPASFHNQM
jgi:hypothetical protein